MRGSLLSSALLLLWPGFGLHSCNLPTFGPVCMAPGGLTIDRDGLTTDEKRALFLLPNIWRPSPLARCLAPFLASLTLRVRPFLYGSTFRAFTPGSVPGSGFIRKKDPLFIPYVLGTFHPKWVFLGGLGVVGSLRPLSPSFVPYPFILHRSKV